MRVRVALLLLLVLIVGCSSGEDGSLSLFGPKPTALDSSSAESVTTTFLDAWKDFDYETMYSLITPNARDAFSPEEFTDIYQQVAGPDYLALKSLEWEITAGPLVQGTTAMVEYTVTFDTNLLGVFSDPNPEYPDAEPRTMWLVATPNEGWRVAWSRMDIFSGWTNDSRLRIESVLPQRGSIYDRNGRVLVNQGGTVVSIYVIENRMPNTDACASALARILNRELDDIQLLFNDYLDDSRFLVGEISQETANQEDAVLRSVCNYEGIPRTTRQYFDRVAPHIVGYVGQIPANRETEYLVQGYPPDALVGREGLEEAFEDELRGTIGVQLFIESPNGVPIRTIAARPPEPGQSLYLTIDRDLQLGVQALLADAYRTAIPTWSNTSKGAAVVVMDVNTGEILAIASYPDFDPSVFNPDTRVFNPSLEIQRYSEDPRTPMLNRATIGSYPLGSVFKVFSTVAGLDSGAWLPTNTYFCTGQWDGTPYGDDVRTDWYPAGHNLLDMKGGLVNSCNPYFWNMSVTLNDFDENLLSDYARLFGFGVSVPLQGLQTDSGFIQSPASKRRNSGEWGYGDAANLVIGQGDMTVNPLQVVRATAAVANNGTLYDPIMVDHVGIIGETPTFQAQPNGRDLDIDPAVLQLTREAMCDVTVTYEGTANFVFQEWYEHNAFQVIVCGKTGTAQSGGVQPHAWFAAFAPDDNPQIAVVAIVENSCEGSEVSAPIVRRVLELYYPQLDPNFGWPPLWQSGCTEIGPNSTG